MLTISTATRNTHDYIGFLRSRRQGSYSDRQQLLSGRNAPPNSRQKTYNFQ